MTFHKLIKIRIKNRKKELSRMKKLGRFLLRKPNYEIDEMSYNKGLKKLLTLTKIKLIQEFLTDEDVIFYNELDS